MEQESNQKNEKPNGIHSMKFSTFSSTVEASYWIQLSKHKLHELRLEEGPVDITGYYTTSFTENKEISLPPRLRVTSLVRNENRNELINCQGSFYVYNTIETLKRVNKNELLKSFFVEKMMNIQELSSFLCICFLDLKSHDCFYWFAFPALATKPGYNLKYSCEEYSIPLEKHDCEGLYKAFHVFRREERYLPPFFLYLKNNQNVICLSINDYSSLSREDKSQAIFSFLDPSSSPHPGWPMRNLISYLSLQLQFNNQSMTILSFRPKVIRRIDVNTDPNIILGFKEDKSLLFHVTIPDRNDYLWTGDTFKVVGWELNARSKMGPRHISLSTIMSSTHLAKQAINLNLNLMKWRLLPSLNLNMLGNTKVLLLGSGTLGCNVARILLGYGISSITFVDQGKVSHSNPVRQTLFEMNDVGKPKAAAACEALKRIAPVESNSYHLSIPMPGHCLEKTSDLQKIEELIENHDVIYLLTDTRESRWLPTLLSTYHKKMCINVALGLDTFLVCRQGNMPKFGCYFCNDVVAPDNSMKERTIDQQCTVTRPGLSPIAASLAVELMVSLLHHPQRHYADVESSHELGKIIPHQIRGSIHTFSMLTPTTSPSFEYCTACSVKILKEYSNHRMNFISKVCSTDGRAYLEEVTGLIEFREKADAVDFDCWDDDD